MVERVPASSSEVRPAGHRDNPSAGGAILPAVPGLMPPLRVSGAGDARAAGRGFRGIWAVLAAAALLPCAPLAGQATRTTGPLLLEVPASTRGLALGGAFHVGGRDSDAVFLHPGLLNNPSGMTGGVQLWGRGGTLVQLSAGIDWFGGGVALGVQSLDYGIAPGGFASLPVDEGELRGRGRSSGASERVVAGGYGRVVRGVRMGLTASAVELRVDGRRDITGAVGVGAARTAGPAVLALSARNLGPALSSGGESLDLAREVTMAVAPVRPRPVGPLDLNGAFRVSLLEDNSLVVGGGVELSWWPIQGRTLLLRVGRRGLPEGSSARPWTLGGGFQGDRLGLEWAMVGFREGSASHRIGLHFR